MNILTCRMIWVALMLSQIMLFAMCRFLSKTWELSRQPTVWFAEGTLDLPFIVMGAIMVVVSFVFPKVLLNKTVGSPNYQSSTNKLQVLFTPFVLSMAMGEAITLLGFMLAFMQQNPEKLLPFMAAGIIRCIWVFPKDEATLEKRLLLV